MNTTLLQKIKKIVVIGPECTGKSELSNYLANYYQTPWVPEYARAYLNNLARPYAQHDLTTIAQGQISMEDEYVKKANKVLICDTNLFVIKIWSEIKYGTCSPDILTQIASRHYDLYLLTYIDVPWEDDPQREHPQLRSVLYQRYLLEMKNQQVPFVEIKGPREIRRKSAVDAIETIVLSA